MVVTSKMLTVHRLFVLVLSWVTAGILEQHPQVMMAGRKELHFFDNKTPTPRSAEMYAGNFAR